MAPRKCFLPNCSNHSGVPREGLHYHGLPKDVPTRKLWCQWIASTSNLQEWGSILSKTIYLCSDHFSKDDVGLKKLKPRALPCIVNPPGEEVITCPLASVACNNFQEHGDLKNSSENQSTSFQEHGDLKNSSENQSTSNVNGIQSLTDFSSIVIVDINVDNKFRTHEMSEEATIQEFTLDKIVTSENQMQFDELPNIPATRQQSTLDEVSTLDEINGSNESFLWAQLPNSIQEVVVESTSLKNPANKPKRIKCSAKDCENESEQYHSFPSTLIDGAIHHDNILRQWIKNTGNHDLLNMTHFNPSKKFFLCSSHFDDSQYYNKLRKKLLPTAVPTIFECLPLHDTDVGLLFSSGHIDVTHAVIDEDHETDGEIFKPDELQKKFEEKINSFEWRRCYTCNEKFMTQKKNKTKCIHSKNICKQYSDINDMDPLSVPEELTGLTYIEEQLIARVHPLVTVFKLNNHQYGYSGNVINFAQDIKEIAKKLPHKVNDLSSVITVRTRNELKPVDFQIRSHKVRIALEWLVTHNDYYHDVELSEENLQSLPEDGNVYEDVTAFFQEDVSQTDSEPNIDCNSDEEIISTDKGTGNVASACSDCSNSSFTNSREDDTNIDHDTENFGEEEEAPFVVESGVPMVGHPSEKSQIESAIDWPSIDANPINEFHTEGYISMAFPCLFPYGKADLKSPREKAITPLNYFKHLMKYHDGRFATHPRFRYFALNSLMRWSALKDGNIFVKRHPEFKNLSVNDLKIELEKHPHLLNKIMFQSSNIRGTRSFWYAKGQELLSMVKQLGLPTLFFTLSAADFHWPDLYKVLAPDDDFRNLSESKRRKLIADNPQIVDSFFYERSKIFIEDVLCKKFCVKDYWYRVEYQHRGSPHIHGLLWLDDAPDVTDLTSHEKKENVVKFFHDLVKTQHPNINERPAPVHPCRIKISEISNETQDLAQLLNKVQRHSKCTDGYCLRINKKTRKKECRFKFPQELQEMTKLVLNEDNEYELVTERNDPLLNKFNPYVITSWRANCDFSPVLSKRALINYLAKYVSKPEKESKQLMDILRDLLEHTDEGKAAKTAVQRLYIKCCADRDYSAQETCHLLNGLKMVSSGGRNFVKIPFLRKQNEWVFVPKDGRNPPKSIFEKYGDRCEMHEHESLSYMAKNFDFGTGKKYQKEAILQVYPMYKEKPVDDDDNEFFYRQQVLLYVPWRDENSFLENENTWKDVYMKFKAVIDNNKDKDFDLCDISPDENEYEDIDIDDDFTMEEWMTISRMGPGQTVEKVELGRRELDLQHDWHLSLSYYERFGGILSIRSFIKQQKENTSTVTSLPPFPNVIFSKEQQNILNLVNLQIKSVVHKDFSCDFEIPKRIIVQGRAGTGKSLAIQAMTNKIHAALGHDSYIIMTPTGVSANAINGSTYHSKLHINGKTLFVPLMGQASHELQKNLKNVHFMIVDEYSMIGCEAMHMIEQRIQEAKGDTGEDFSSLFVFLFGDIRQLPPVGDSPLYSDNVALPEKLRGKLIFNNFQGSIILSQIKRQNDPVFQSLLNNIGEGNVSQTDYNLLKKRFTSSNLSRAEKDKFNDAIRLYCTRLEVLCHNRQRLENLKTKSHQLVPVARIPAVHNIPDAKKGTIDDAEGLHPTLYLAEGARIMLKMNLWTEKGLVNGAMGYIVHILYDEQSNPPEDPPAVIVCKFDKYEGPFLDINDKTVPIIPYTKSWTKNGQSLSRTQFPITLCYACCIHSSQSLSLDLVYVDIGSREMATGLTYVAFSRARSLEGLLIAPFKVKRLLNINTKDAILKRNRWVKNLEAIQLPDFGIVCQNQNISF